MTFPNPPVATMRVARITQRDRSHRGKLRRLAKETLLPVVDLSPLVMAIWSERTIWDIRGRFSQESHVQQEKQGSQYRSRRRGRQHVSTHTRGGAAAYARRSRNHVQGGPENGHTLGEGRQAHVNPDARRSPPVPGN